jgi:hypothetical protein
MTITSRTVIAAMADEAAQHWTAHRDQPKPANPFSPIADPEHFREFAASFERFLLAYSAPECEASA